jgi:plasmid maintenance system antidote protein VapI
MKDAPTISDALRRAIADCGIPLLTIEKETGVVRASIMRFVRGDQTIRLDAADRLAAFFGLRLVAGPTRPTKPAGTRKRKAK